MDKTRLLSRLGSVDKCLKTPLVELVGCGRVLIENHTGVLAYSPEEITVRVNYGCLQISGENMMLAEMSREQLVITGQINCVNLHRR